VNALRRLLNQPYPGTTRHPHDRKDLHMTDTLARLDRFRTDLEALRHPVRGTARIDAAGVVTVGAYADGTPAGWPLLFAGRARHTTVVGSAGSGKTMLMRSLLHGAATADISAQIIDLGHGQLGGLPHPIARDLAAARTVLGEIYGIAHRDRTNALRLLVIDDLPLLTRDAVAARQLHELSLIADGAGIAIIAGVQHPGLSAYGQATLGEDAEQLRDRLAQEVVLQHIHAPYTVEALLNGGPDLPPLPSCLSDGTSLAGVGFLPRHRRTPFRAWRP
jgi:hypothetical protein